MRRKVFALAAALALALLLAGCGEAGPDNTPAGTESAQGVHSPDDPENVPSDLEPSET